MITNTKGFSASIALKTDGKEVSLILFTLFIIMETRLLDGKDELFTSSNE